EHRARHLRGGRDRRRDRAAQLPACHGAADAADGALRRDRHHDDDPEHVRGPLHADQGRAGVELDDADADALQRRLPVPPLRRRLGARVRDQRPGPVDHDGAAALPAGARLMAAAAARSIVRPRARRARGRRLAAGVLLTALLALLGLAFLFPFFYMVSASLKDVRELFTLKPSLLPERWLWDN